MSGRYIVRTFKNGVKHFWDTETGSCIHYSKVQERIPKKEFAKLYKEFNSKQSKKENVTEPLPKLSDILIEVLSVYSDKTSIEEIIGSLEMCKTYALTVHQTKK
jgi:vacuolar-type H+-ATPase subunit I/STV1